MSYDDHARCHKTDQVKVIISARHDGINCFHFLPAIFLYLKSGTSKIDLLVLMTVKSFLGNRNGVSDSQDILGERQVTSMH